MIRLQFSTSLEWQSHIIRRICHSRFSHVDIVLPDGNLLGASDSPKAPFISGNPGGVAIRPPNYQLFGIRRIAEIACDELVEGAFIANGLSQLGEPFDDSALHALLGNDVSPGRDWTDSDAWFCSEHCAWSLMCAGFWKFDLLISKGYITPADLLLLVNPYMINIGTFWDPIPGLKLGPKEIGVIK
jgi:hypothetical protein